MKTIYKYTLDPTKRNPQKIQMHQQAKILCAKEQGDDICLWAEVESNYIKEDRLIEVFMTGQEIPVGMGVDRVYINTVTIGNLARPYVFHVYERLN